MRKLIAIVVVLIAGWMNESNAQLLKNYGLKVAFTSADQSYEFTLVPGVETKRRAGFNAGAFVEWFDVPVFSLVTQVEYAQRGVGQDFVITGPSGPDPLGVRTMYSRLDYLSVPVLAKFRLPAGGIVPYIVAGPRVDFLLGYRSDDDVSNDVYDKFKKTSLGSSVGAGVQVGSVLPFTVLAEARYNFDFADSYQTEFLKVRNNAFDFWVGIAL